jgi:tetratricopeptide (TPR) repeat protein
MLDGKVTWRPALALRSQGKLGEARKAYEQCLEIRKKLTEQDPSNAGWQRELSRCYERIGNILSSQGKLEDARNRFDPSVKTIQFQDVAFDKASGETIRRKLTIVRSNRQHSG